MADVTGVITGQTEERARRLGADRPAAPGDRAGGATPDGEGTAAERTPADRVRLPHEPALDGLRGLAVVAVVVFHLDRIDGGFLGVDLFFVLSGFLITSLLLTEHRGRGTIDLGRFWVRRARRLLPALFLVVVGIAVLLLWLTPEAERAGFRGDGLSTLLYVANWHAMADAAGYWDIFGQPSPFDHMWSLAIEEQFYVVWPLLALVVLGAGRARRRSSVSRRSRPVDASDDPATSTPRGRDGAGGRLARWSGRARGLAARYGVVVPEDRGVLALGLLALVGAVVSLGLLWRVWLPGDSNRAYFSTDTRIGPTLLGAALAVVTVARPRRDGPPPAAVELLAVLALGWMAVCMVAIDGIGPSYYHGGLASFTVATLVVIHAVTGGPTGPTGQPGLVGRVIAWRPLAWLGTISYGVYLWHWPVIVYLTSERAHVEGLLLDGLRVGVTLAVAVASFRLVEQPLRRGTLSGRRLRGAFLGACAVSLVAVLVATAGTPRTSFIARPRGTLLGVDNAYLHVPASVPAGTPKLLLVGDSGPVRLGPELVEAGDDAGVAVAFSSQLLCTVVNSDDVGRQPDGTIKRREPCPEDPNDLWADLVDEYDPDVVVYYLANAGGLDRERVGGQWVWDCDAPYDRYLEQALGEVVDLLGSGGARVVIATSPYVGILEPTSDQRVDCRNDTYRRVAAAHPGAGIVDLNRFVEREKDVGVRMLGDPVHLSEEGAERVSPWLLDQLVSDGGAT